jgi:hypothetical protein
MQAGADRRPSTRGPIRGPQSFVSGLVLVALALFAIWLTRDLPQGTLRAMGPAMLPRWLAIGVGLCGLALVVIGFLRNGDPLERFTLRGPLVVAIAILCFGLTIRGFNLGGIQVPLLGLMVSGPLAIFISGFASPEARLRDLLILALALTAFCMALFGDLLNLPIPMYPQSFADLYPRGWSSDARLRTTAGILALLAAAIFLATHRRRRANEPIDVADHQVEHGGRGRI